LPFTPRTSSLPRATRPSISGLRPIVPMITGLLPAGTVSCTTAGSTPVTFPRSVRRSPTARMTPAWSLPLTTSGAARPPATSGKWPGPGRVTT
jgi:hypothetical protein